MKKSKRGKRDKKDKPLPRAPENWKVITLEGRAHLYETMYNTEIAVAVAGKEDALKFIAQAANEGHQRGIRKSDLRRALTKEITSRYVHLRDAFGKVRKQAKEIAEAFEFAEGCLETREKYDR